METAASGDEGEARSSTSSMPMRPWEQRAATRSAAVWAALAPWLEQPSLAVVDVGGGTGALAVRIARAGHEVRLVDPSPDALAAAARRAAEHGVSARVIGVQGDLDDLASLVAPGSADVVLCHEVLGLSEDPRSALASIHTALRPGGWVSLVVAQRHAPVVARAMAGHFAAARELLDADAPGEKRFSATECAELLGASGFDVATIRGVRVFTDLVPAALADLEVGASSALVDLELAVADREDFWSLAAQLHVLATRPD